MRGAAVPLFVLALAACAPVGQPPAPVPAESTSWAVERKALEDAEAALLRAIQEHAEARGRSGAEAEAQRRVVEERHLALRILLERLRLMELDREADVQAGRGGAEELRRLREERQRRLARLAEIERLLSRPDP